MKITHKQYALTAFLALFLFWITYFIMAGLRPGYSFLTKAVSELGSTDAPNKWIWNGLGYIIPGILISVFSRGWYQSLYSGSGSKLPFYSLCLNGVLMVLSGIFPGDFEHRTSLTMLLHSIGSLGSYLFFLLAAFGSIRHAKGNTHWQTSVKFSLLLTWLSILSGSWGILFPQWPGAGQRFVFGFYFLWIGWQAYNVSKTANITKTAPSVM